MRLAILLAGIIGPWVPGLTPPAQYDHPCKRLVLEIAVPKSQVNAACSKISGRRITMAGACSRAGFKDDKPIWIIVIPSDSGLIDVYRRHEIAHCNGWRHG